MSSPAGAGGFGGGGELFLGGADGFAQQGIVGRRGEAIELGGQRGEAEHADGVGAGGAHPGVVAGDQRGHGLFGRLDRRAQQAIRERDALSHRDLAVEQRDDQAADLRLQDVVEELQRVRAHRRVLRLQADVGAVHVGLRPAKLHQAEDALDFVVHRLLQRQRHRIRVLERVTQLAHDLIRAVVPHDLGGQHHLDRTAIQLDVRVKLVQLVQRRNHPEAQDDIGFEQMIRQDATRFRSADVREDDRDFAADRRIQFAVAVHATIRMTVRPPSALPFA